MKTIKKTALAGAALDTARPHFNKVISYLATIPADILVVLVFVLLPIVSFIMLRLP